MVLWYVKCFLSRKKMIDKLYLNYIKVNKIEHQKTAEKKWTHRSREHFDSCQIERELERRMKKLKELRSTN